MANRCDPLEFPPYTYLSYPPCNASIHWKVRLENRFSMCISLEVSGQPCGGQPSTSGGRHARVMSVVAREGTMRLCGWNESFKGVPDFYFGGIMSFCEIKFVFK